MNIIQNWGAVLSLITVACGILEMLLPSGKLSKTAYQIISLFVVLAALLPMINALMNFKCDLKSLVDIPKLKQNSDFLEEINSQVSNLACKTMKTAVKSKLREIGINPEKIEIFMDINESSGIVITRCKIYISRELKDSDLKISEEISKELGIEAEVIEV